MSRRSVLPVLEGVGFRTVGRHVELLVQVGGTCRVVDRREIADAGAGFDVLVPRAKFTEGKALWPTTSAATRRQKFNARKTVVDGITFDSAKEAARYRDLVLRLRAGEIRDLRLQPTFELRTAGTAAGVQARTGIFSADFDYVVVATGARVIEDAKGGTATATTAYRLRKRAVEAAYGITIVEV